MEDQTVVDALACVIAELPGIGKDQHASQAQGGYSYRGIEAITKSAAPLFAKYGIVFVPQVLDCDIRDITVNNKPWTDTILTVRYRICGPAGDFLEATVVGIGRDNADKGANKALTQAFKYALIQTLCVADAKDDADGTHTERDALPAPEPMATKRQADEFGLVLDSVPDSVAADFKAWKATQRFKWPWTLAALNQMETKLDELVGASEANTPPAGVTSSDGDGGGEPAPDTDKAGSAAAPASPPPSLADFSGEPF